MPKKRTVYKGDQFGKLTVLDTTDKKHVFCMCKCGTEIICLKSNLTTGKSKSCGKGICQSHFKDLTGQIFGFLLSKEIVSFDDHGAVWKCLCICGKEYNVRGNSLLNGRTKSCGCKSAELTSIAISKEPGLSNIIQLFNTYKNQAKLREYSFELSLDNFKQLISDDCFYCGIEPQQKLIISNILGDRILLYNGIDRMNNTKGYITGNVVSACGMCNIAKKNFPFDEFIEWIGRVSKHLSERKII